MLGEDAWAAVKVHGAHFQQRHHHVGTGLGSFISGSLICNTTAYNVLNDSVFPALWQQLT